MCVFIGDYQIKLDSKGRFLFPAAFVEQLGKEEAHTFVIKRDIYEKCLTIYTASSWQARVEAVKAHLNPFNRQHNVFLREFFKDTAEVGLDSSNRLLVPKRLLLQAELKSDIFVLGLDDKIEVWDTEIYNESRPDIGEYAKMAQDFLGNLAL
jgi:MraZ protein